MMQKAFLALVILGVILVSGCVQQSSEPQILQSGLQYPAEINKINYDTSKVIEHAKLDGYALRILKSPVGCRNPLPDGGCTGSDYIAPEFDYINVNQGDFPNMEEAWQSSTKWLAVNDDSLAIRFSTDDYDVHVLAPSYGDKGRWSIGVIPSKDVGTNEVKYYINQEFIKTGIISDGYIINIRFNEGHVLDQQVAN